MKYIYRDVETGKEINPTYSVMELNREHRIRYVMTFDVNGEKQAIVLRHLPWRMKQVIDDVRFKLYPKTAELLQEAKDLEPYFKDIPEDQWQEDKIKRLQEIGDILTVTNMYALGVIVAPCVADMDDVNDIYDQLSKDDRQRLAMAIDILCTMRDADEIDGTALEIAKANGLQIMEKEMLDMMTVSQANYYIKRIEAENERIRQMYGEKVVQ